MEEQTAGKINQGKEISLKEVILKVRGLYYYLLSKWAYILCFLLLGAAAGYAYAWSRKTMYNATTTFVLEEANGSGGMGQYAGLASMVGLDVGSGGGGIFQGDNILELYKSRAMIEKTLLTTVEFNGHQQLLIDRYIDFNKLRNTWAKNPALANIHFDTTAKAPAAGFTRTQDSIINIIVADINKSYMAVVKPDKKLSIIRAEVKAPDEFFAKTFNQEMVRNVNDFYLQTKTKKSLQNIAILVNKTDSVRRVLNGAIYSAAAAADATPNLNITRQIQRVGPVQRSQFSAETNKAILSELVKNLELSRIALLKETPLIQVIDQPVFPLEVIRFGKVKGAVIGAFAAFFLSLLVFTAKKIIKDILSNS